MGSVHLCEHAGVHVWGREIVRVCVHVCMQACVRACMRACVNACVRVACVRACVHVVRRNMQGVGVSRRGACSGLADVHDMSASGAVSTGCRVGWTIHHIRPYAHGHDIVHTVMLLDHAAKAHAIGP